MKVFDGAIKFSWLVFICLVCLLSACSQEDASESIIVSRDTYTLCGNIDFEISRHISDAEIFQITEVSDKDAYREMLTSELSYFENMREELTDCIFENAMNVSEAERAQMMDLDQRIAGAAAHLRIIIEDDYILEPGCAKCAPEQLVFLKNDWFQPVDSGGE